MALIKLNTRSLSDNSVTEDKIVNAGNIGRRNLLDNGSFQVWQRGAGPFTVNNFGCDRWYGWGNQHNLTRQGATQNHGYSLRVAHNDGGANGFSAIAQTCEYETAAWARGKTLTFSCKVRKGSAFTGTLSLQIVERTDSTASINTGTRNVLISTDFSSSLTTNSQRFSVTTTSTISNSAQAIGVNVIHGSTTGTDANNWFEVEECQLEVGTTPTDFEFSSLADTLQRCQRFYEQGDIVCRHPFQNQLNHIFNTPVYFKVQKRATPNVSQSNGYTTDGQASYGIEGHGGGGYNSKKDGFAISTTTSTTSNSISMVQANWTASAEL